MNTSTQFQLKPPATVAGFAKQHGVKFNYTEITDGQKSALRQTVEDWDKVPSARKAGLDLIRTIEGEERRNSTINSKDIKVNDDCSLSFGEETFPISSMGFKGIVRSIAPSGALTYLSHVDPELRAHNIRYLLNEDSKVLKMRTRNAFDGGREVFSVVSGEYPDVTAKDVLEMVVRRTGEDAKAIWTYNPNTTGLSFREVHQKEIDIHNYKHSTEEVFRIGQEWFLRDDGSTSISLSLMTFRQLCANMILLSPDVLNYKKIRHRGLQENVKKRLEDLYTRASGFTEIFRNQWSDSRHREFHDNPTLDIVVDVYGLLLNKRKLSANGVDKDVLATSLAVAWLEEGGNKVADLVNGVTRYARNLPASNSNVFTSSKIETEAGNLLFADNKLWAETRRLYQPI